MVDKNEFETFGIGFTLNPQKVLRVYDVGGLCISRITNWIVLVILVRKIRASADNVRIWIARLAYHDSAGFIRIRLFGMSKDVIQLRLRKDHRFDRAHHRPTTRGDCTYSRPTPETPCARHPGSHTSTRHRRGSPRYCPSPFDAPFASLHERPLQRTRRQRSLPCWSDLWWRQRRSGNRP